MTQRSDSGLTLVEVLVSLVILSVIGLAGLTMLDATLRVQRGTEGQIDRLTEMDRAFAVLRRDFAFATQGDMVLRDGRLTLGRSTVSEPLTVEIALEQGALGRWVTPSAAQRPESPQLLLTGVNSLSWRILDPARMWRSDWPGGGRPARAAELTLLVTLTEQGAPQAVARIFPLPAGASP